MVTVKKKKEEEKPNLREIPEEEAAARAERSARPTELSTLTDPRSGRPTGVVTPEGKTFLGATGESIRSLEEKQLPQFKDVIREEDTTSQRLAQQSAAAAFLQQVSREEAALGTPSLQQEEIFRRRRLEEEGGVGLRGGLTSNVLRGALDIATKRLPFIPAIVGRPADLPFTSPEEEAALLGMNPQQVVRTGTQNSIAKRLENNFERLFTRVFGDINVFGLSVENFIDALTNREKANELESSMGKLGETFSAIRGVVDAEGITPQKGLAMLNQQEENVLIIESRIRQAANLDPRIKTTGEYTNILAEVAKTKIELTEARADILARARETQGFDVFQTQLMLEELER